MTEPINAGELSLELRADQTKFFQDIEAASKKAADQIASDLQNTLSSSLNNQNQINQSIQQQNQAQKQGLDIQKEALKDQIEYLQLKAQQLELDQKGFKLQGQYSDASAQELKALKETIAAQQELLKVSEEREESAKRLNSAQGSRSNNLAAESINLFNKEQNAAQEKALKQALASYQYEQGKKPYLQEELKLRQEISSTLEKAAQYSKQIQDQTQVDLLKTQSSRDISSNALGLGGKGKAQNVYQGALNLEGLQLSQKLSQEESKYNSLVSEVNAKHQARIGLMHQLGESEDKILEAEKQHAQGLEKLKTDYQQIRSEVQALSAENVKNIQATFDKAKSETSSLKFFFREIMEGFANQLGSSVISLVTNAFQTAVSTITGTIGSSLDVFKKYESLKVTINIASQGQGSEAFAFLEKAADRYKIKLDVLADSYKGFVAASLSSGNSLNETNYVYERLISTGRALSLSNEDIKGSVEAVTQIFSKGKIQAEELRGQLGDRFPGSVQIMAQALGVGTQELERMLQKGELTSDALFSFASKLEEKYGSKLPEALKTSAAASDDLANSVFKIQKDFGQAINPFNQAAIEAASAILNQISRDVFTELNDKANQFRAYLQQNPQIIQNISASVSKLLKEGLNFLAQKAGDLLDYLKKNPSAIEDAVKKAVDFAHALGDIFNWAVQVTTELAKWAAPIGNLTQAIGGPLVDGLKKVFDWTSQITGGFFGLSGLMQLAARQGQDQAGQSSGGAVKSGLFTGPSERNGGSAAYHVDVKISTSLPKEQVIGLFDQLAKGYADEGRKIQFSNAGVAKEVYNPDDANRGDLLYRAFAAHDNHSRHPGFYSADFYIPNKDRDLNDISAEGAEMLLPTIPGATLKHGTGGGYGNYVIVSDAKGNPIFKMGHGDNAKPLPADYGPTAPTSSSSGSSSSSSSSSGGMITSLSADKVKPPISITQNKRIDGYLNRLAFLESTFDTGAYVPSTGASGAFQFTPDTANDAMGAGLPDPRKGSLESQAKAAWLFIQKFHPEAATAIQGGNFSRADQLLSRRWSSLPGGGEEQSAERMAQANSYLNTSSSSTSKNKFSISASTIKSEDVKPGESAEELRNKRESEFKSYQSESKKAQREAEDSQLKAARSTRDSQIEYAKSVATNSQDANKIVSHLAEFTKLNDERQDVTKEADRAIQDQEDALKLMKAKPLEFNENKAQRDKAIKAQETLINTLKANKQKIDETYAKKLEASGLKYREEVNQELVKLRNEKETYSLTASNAHRQALDQLALAAPDLNQYDRSRLELQQANAALEADDAQKRLPLQQEKKDLESQLEKLNATIKSLPKEMQGVARNDPRFRLLTDRIEFVSQKLSDIGSEDFYKRQANERKAQKIDQDQAKSIVSANNSADDELNQLKFDAYKTSLENQNLNPLDITVATNQLAKSNAVEKINRDLALQVDSLKEAGTWSQELEDKLTKIAGLKIDALKVQFKDLATIIKDELNGQFKEFFSGLDGGFKTFFTDMISGTKSIGESFKGLFSNILSQLAQLAVNRIFTQLLGGKGIGGLFQPKESTGLLGLAGSVIGAFSGGGGGLASSLFTGASSFGLASGVSLTPFASGGIVSSPTAALIGEAGYSEAIIPMPNGRSIPVEFNGARSGGGNSSAQVAVAVTINNNGGASITGSAGGALGKQLQAAVESVINQNLKPGGSINRAIKSY